MRIRANELEGLLSESRFSRKTTVNPRSACLNAMHSARPYAMVLNA